MNISLFYRDYSLMILLGGWCFNGLGREYGVEVRFGVW